MIRTNIELLNVQQRKKRANQKRFFSCILLMNFPTDLN